MEKSPELERTDVFEKYEIKRKDGKDNSNEVYFVLRLDRPGHWWDIYCRTVVKQMGKELQMDAHYDRKKFGEELEKWASSVPVAKPNPFEKEEKKNG